MCQYGKCRERLNLLCSRGTSPRLGYWLKLVYLFVNTGVTAGGQGLWKHVLPLKVGSLALCRTTGYGAVFSSPLPARRWSIASSEIGGLSVLSENPPPM